VSVAVRRATANDARAIAEVHVETWRAAYVDVMPAEVLDALDVDQREQLWRRYVAAEGYAQFVAEQDGRVVGFVSAGSCPDLEHTGELFAIYVVPGSWSTGAGLALMHAAVEWLAERWDEAVLWVATENPRARRFYERYGWVVDGERVDTSLIDAPIPETRYRLSGLKQR
jgi:ribosomal protein S18 acetylase RimI-like enzyme